MITIFIGVSGSGKTTEAKKMLATNPNAIRVNRDDLRKTLFGAEQTDQGYYLRKDFKQCEDMVSLVVDQIIYDGLNKGADILLDNTHLKMSYINDIIRKYNHLAPIELFIIHEESHTVFNTIEDRLLKRYNGDKEAVKYLTRQWKDFGKLKAELHMKQLFYPQMSSQVIFDKSLPDTFIFDIDGNLAKKGDRNIFDDSKLHLDTEIKPVGTVLRALAQSGQKIIFLSGRQDSAYDATKDWLEVNGLWTKTSEMFMRKTKDQRCDSIVKEELLQKYVVPRYNVIGVFDDRLRVNRTWYKLGVFCFNTNQSLVQF